MLDVLQMYTVINIKPQVIPKKQLDLYDTTFLSKDHVLRTLINYAPFLYVLIYYLYMLVLNIMSIVILHSSSLSLSIS